MYLLDTNVISELRKTRPHGGVIAWLDSVSVSEVFLPPLRLASYRQVPRGRENRTRKKQRRSKPGSKGFLGLGRLSPWTGPYFVNGLD